MGLLHQLQALPDQWERLLRERITPIMQELWRIAKRGKNPLKSTFDLGCDLMERGAYEEAKIRFKIVLWRRPTLADGWYNMAMCHFSLGEQGEGLNALNKALALNPKDEMALYMKASYKNGEFAETYTPHTVPLPVIRHFFGGQAAGYDDAELLKGYQAHSYVLAQLAELPIRPMASLLDAGCGTGLCGALVKPLVHKLVGIDVTPQMVAQARALSLYDELLEGDLRDHLLNAPAPLYDYILAAHVMPWVGGLTPVMDGVARALKPEGYFIFTAYALQAMEGYRFVPDIKQFVHTRHYLKACAERAGLKAVSLKEITIYENDPRPAYLVVLQK